jgi:hypothetical protein
MALIQLTAIRVDYDYEKKRWFVDTPMVLDNRQLVKVLLNARMQLSQRAKGEMGQRKQDMLEAIKNMSPLTTDQYLLGNGEKTLYLGPNVKL